MFEHVNRTENSRDYGTYHVGKNTEWYNGKRFAKLSRMETHAENVMYCFLMCDGSLVRYSGQGSTARAAYRDAYREYRINRPDCEHCNDTGYLNKPYRGGSPVAYTCPHCNAGEKAFAFECGVEEELERDYHDAQYAQQYAAVQ